MSKYLSIAQLNDLKRCARAIEEERPVPLQPWVFKDYLERLIGEIEVLRDREAHALHMAQAGY